MPIASGAGSRPPFLRGNPRNILLVGFMGSGKTSVGRLLARRLGWRFLDLDSVVERAMGQRVGEIFRKRGECGFRSAEHRAVRSLARLSRRVVATGGGVPVFRRNRPWLRRAGLTVYIRVSPRELARRLRRATDRPLLARARGDSRALGLLVTCLLRSRERAYRRSDMVVEAGRMSAREVAAAIARRLHFHARRGS